jgi:CheY-like chemotaxis protein
MPDKPLVLIVEDNPDFQHLYGLIAEAAGYAVEVIPDGGTAMLRLQAEPVPSIMLLDCLLPGADGDSILAAVRLNPLWNQVKVFYLTADVRVTRGYRDYLPGAPQPDGVIEKGAEAIRQLRTLFSSESQPEK